jgi:hypothetical protein
MVDYIRSAEARSSESSGMRKSSLPTVTIVQLYKTGEDIEDIADEFDCTDIGSYTIRIALLGSMTELAAVESIGLLGSPDTL